ncbi:MAG TPA: mannose-1-phosphate guanylyltransferase/mannose-6-phosphate isomerase [Desulfobacterales bacterium]|nr:mannose-1-phosphate guanylyltransferase/mannose-6-phosphate isomerase [Desulfobacterales bacterium]
MPERKSPAYSVILAGGSGTRLWPLSRERYPKQLVNFFGGDSLIQITMKRMIPVLNSERIRVVCGEDHCGEVARHMEEIGIPSHDKIICEPCGRNTGPAILLSVFNILGKENDAIICVFPSDHVIRDTDSFHQKLKIALKLAEMGFVVTFGIKPHYPETGYGYIEGLKKVSEDVLTVKRFVEKPDVKTAKKYIQSGRFFWNSGMFAFKASVIMEEFKVFQPELFKKMEELFCRNEPVTKREYEQLPNISIDYAVMEKTSRGVVIDSDFGWSDIGSWKSFYDYHPKDENNSVIDGDVISRNTRNCLILGSRRLIAANNLNGIVIVETGDSVFVSDMDTSREVKCIVEKLKEKGRAECNKHPTMNYQWGSEIVLEEKENFNVTRFMIYPACRLRVTGDGSSEKQLLAVNGRLTITTDNQSRLLQKGESTVIRGNTFVELENSGKKPLHIVQVEIRPTDG